MTDAEKLRVALGQGRFGGDPAVLVPALVAEVRRLRAENAAWRDAAREAIERDAEFVSAAYGEGTLCECGICTLARKLDGAGARVTGGPDAPIIDNRAGG